MLEFFTKYALVLKVSALAAAGVAVVGGVSFYAATRAQGQNDPAELSTGEVVAAVALEEEAQVYTEESTTEEPTAQPATESTTRRVISKEEQKKNEEEVSSLAEEVEIPTATEGKGPEKPSEAPKPVEPEGPPVIPEEPEVPTEPEEPDWAISPVKYQLYRTLTSSGFSKDPSQKWSGTDQYYNDGEKVDSWRGIDISTWQGEINFNAVKKSGVDFVIIRLGARGEETGKLIIDDQFNRNIEAAGKAGLNIGVYFYSQAITEVEAIEEAKLVLEQLGKHPDVQLTYPVVMDVEGGSSTRLGKLANSNTDQLNKNVRAFCEVIRQAGYYPLIYANQDYAENKLDFGQLPYDYWMAVYRSYNTAFGRDIPFTMWQYTDSGKVSGISGYVDMNVSLVDYASYLRRNGWNKLK